MIIVSAVSQDAIDPASAQIRPVLREMHKLMPHDEDDFTILTQADIANIFGSVSKVMTILLAAIASISIVVAGIGIMNIMLVSITESSQPRSHRCPTF